MTFGRIFHLDAFANHPFSGNPAAVVPVDDFPPDAVMQAVAAENNLAETAFIVRSDGHYRIRWFTPTVEVPLCGHATLASGTVVMERLEPGRDQVTFHSASGPLTVERGPAGYRISLPAREVHTIDPPRELAAALATEPTEVAVDGFNYLALLRNAQLVRRLSPDLGAVARLDQTGVIVTAVGDGGYDFVSRYFAPAKGIPEDPFTGGAHCALVPFWAARLGQTDFRAFQASKRGGLVVCGLRGDRVELEGGCVFYLEGDLRI